MSSTPFITDVGATSYGRQIGLDTQDSSPPVEAYVTVDDSLWIMVSCAIPSIIVTVIARILLPDGSIVANNWTATNPNGRVASYTQIRLPEGFILSISATANLAQTAGNAFVGMYISRSMPGSFQAAQMLAQGYTYNNQPISWPGGISKNSTDDAGNIRSIVGTTPAAGANISETVPGSARWRVISFMFTLTTAIAVATRDVVLTFDDGSVIFSTAISVNTQAASLAITYTALGYSSNGLAASLVIEIPMLSGFILSPAFRIRTAVQNLQAGDQLSAPNYLVEEWLLP